MPVTITVETGTGADPDANSYVSVADLEAYAADRGKTIAASDPGVLLIQAMDYLSLQNFAGIALDDEQPLSYPTAEKGVPERVKTAQFVLAMMYDSGQDPLAAIERATKSEQVDVIKVEYQDNAAARTLYPQLSALLAPLLATGSGGNNFVVTRA